MARNSNIREEIIETGRKLFAHYGLKKTSMDEIAKTLSITKGSIYYYFKGKEELFIEVINREADILGKKAEEAINKESSPEDKLRAYILVRLSNIKDLKNFYSIFKNEYMADYDMILAIRKKYEDRQMDRIRSILEEGVSRKAFIIKDLDLAAYAVYAQMKDLENPFGLAMDSGSLENIVDGLLVMFLDGIKKR